MPGETVRTTRLRRTGRLRDDTKLGIRVSSGKMRMDRFLLHIGPFRPGREARVDPIAAATTVQQQRFNGSA